MQAPQETKNIRSGAKLKSPRAALFAETFIPCYEKGSVTQTLDQWLATEDFHHLSFLRRSEILWLLSMRLEESHERNEIHGNLAHNKIELTIGKGGNIDCVSFTKDSCYHHAEEGCDDDAMFAASVHLADPDAQGLGPSPIKNGLGIPRTLPPEIKKQRVGKKSDIFMFADIAQAILQKAAEATIVDYDYSSTALPKYVFERIVNPFWQQMKAPDFHLRPNTQTVALFYEQLYTLTKIYEDSTKQEASDQVIERSAKKNPALAELLLIAAGLYTKYSAHLKYPKFVEKILDLFNKKINLSEAIILGLVVNTQLPINETTANIVRTLRVNEMAINSRNLKAVKKLMALDLEGHVLVNASVINAMINFMEWKKNAMAYSGLVIGVSLAAMFVAEMLQPHCVENFFAQPSLFESGISGLEGALIVMAVVVALIAFLTSISAEGQLKASIASVPRLQNNASVKPAEAKANNLIDDEAYMSPCVSPAKGFSSVPISPVSPG